MPPADPPRGLTATSATAPDPRGSAAAPPPQTHPSAAALCSAGRSYFFIASFIEEHVAFHAAALDDTVGHL